MLVVLTLCEPTDCSLPGSFVHVILQPRILERVAIPFTRKSFWPGMHHGLLDCRWVLYHLSHQGRTGPFRYDLNQIPYVMEVTNRFKGLDLVHRAPEEPRRRFVTLYRGQWPKPSQRKRNARRQKGCLRRLYKQLRKEEKWGRKGKIHPNECRIPENNKEREEGRLKWRVQRNRGKQ